jgi:hypothetical protein
MPESAARRRKENAAAERREARRPTSLAGDLRAFPEIGPTARRATGAAYPHQRLSALCFPSFFRGAENGQRGPGAPTQKPVGGALAPATSTNSPSRTIEHIMTTPKSPQSAVQENETAERRWINLLNMWHVCGNAACRRARCCRGHIRICFKPNFLRLPEGVREFFFALGDAQEQKLPADELIEWLDAQGLMEELAKWRAAVEGSVGAERAANAHPPVEGERQNEARGTS